MTDSGNYFEVVVHGDSGEPEGKLSALHLRSGEVAFGIEEWDDGEPDPNDSEVIESTIVLSPDQFRAFRQWMNERP